MSGYLRRRLHRQRRTRSSGRTTDHLLRLSRSPPTNPPRHTLSRIQRPRHRRHSVPDTIASALRVLPHARNPTDPANRIQIVVGMTVRGLRHRHNRIRLNDLTIAILPIDKCTGKNTTGASGCFAGGEEEAFVGDFADLVGVVEAEDRFGDKVEDCKWREEYGLMKIGTKREMNVLP